ncbi:MAG: UDP-3-O-acyl-N-acetylglucosamine deacetylase [Desulfobacterales bacterium]|nr:UDP-3-O-acyl-N-acetylglucosamine deacetylase [Desulfobacterales bacterium]
MFFHQRTIKKAVSCEGVGLHSGKTVRLKVKPAEVNHGITFVRTDLPDNPDIRAHFNKVVDTSLATVIGEGGIIVSTIEHLMASLSGLSIDNAIVEVTSYELPIMDGSAGPFAEMLKSAGIKKQEKPRYYFVVKEPIEIEDGEKFVGVYPDPDFRITCTVDYDHPLLKDQTFSVNVTPDIFEQDIASARTFGFLHEVEHMKRYGLARGGSLDNAIVVGKDDILNPDGLRFSDEFVRHKILDCVGDFSLLGMPFLGHVIVRKSGHAFNHAFLKSFIANKSSWDTFTMREIQKQDNYSKLLAN